MDDLSRRRIKELLERGFARTNASLDRIQEKVESGLETTLDTVHALRRHGRKHLYLVKDDPLDEQTKE